MLIVDGQQRLLTLKYFYDKVFKDGTEFKLLAVQKDLEGKTYDDLSPSDQNRLDDSIIHSIIIKQEEPDGGDSSIYQISLGENVESICLMSIFHHIHILMIHKLTIKICNEFYLLRC